MWNKPTEKQLARIPELYATENTPLEEKTIHMHFFIGSCDWYVAEYSKEDRLFFGYANFGDPAFAEWGYISFDELIDLKVGFAQVDREIHFTKKKFKEIN